MIHGRSNLLSDCKTSNDLHDTVANGRLVVLVSPTWFLQIELNMESRWVSTATSISKGAKGFLAHASVIVV